MAVLQTRQPSAHFRSQRQSIWNWNGSHWALTVSERPERGLWVIDPDGSIKLADTDQTFDADWTYDDSLEAYALAGPTVYTETIELAAVDEAEQPDVAIYVGKTFTSLATVYSWKLTVHGWSGASAGDEISVRLLRNGAVIDTRQKLSFGGSSSATHSGLVETFSEGDQLTIQVLTSSGTTNGVDVEISWEE